MSQAAIRASLQSFFLAANIPGLSQVYRAKPTFVSGQTFNLASNGGHGAVGYIHFIGSNESRITLPAVSGTKHVMYDIGLVIMYQYATPPGTPGTAESADWVDGLDVILDGVKAWIRSDPTMGTAGATTLFQGGEGAADLVLKSQDAVIEKGFVHSWNVLEFRVDEIIRA